MPVRRLHCLRHGETEGESSIRYHGAGDVRLSALGREQMRVAGRALAALSFDLVVASPLSRAHEGARLARPGAAVRVEERFREIHFGRWEGLTREEIEARDPALARAWSADPAGFDFPDGERRRDFRARVVAGLRELLALDLDSVLVVAHMGIARTAVEHLCASALPPAVPGLGQWITLERDDAGWSLGGSPGSPSSRAPGPSPRPDPDQRPT